MREVTKGRQQKPRRVMIYGVGGVGKSTLAASFPKPLFIDLEHGLKNIDTHSVQVEDYLDFMSMCEELYDDHDYRTIVVDAADQLQQFADAQVAMHAGVSTAKQVDWGKGIDEMIHLFNASLSALAALQQQRNVMIVLIAHAEVSQFKDPRLEPYDRYRPRLHKDLIDPTVEWCDEVLFMNYVQSQKEVKQSRGKTIKTTATGDRQIYTAEAPAWIAKNRCGMPDVIEPTWDSYKQYAFSE